ncbi:unnamed protein product [Parnassius apollo]|uniref:(apollo) hypothetical protein n=1 Tax=Parnassius apollo TaxID=110799 RepID=A0A8S3WVZ7_PARAO|nr:unnamed protein product [Parnassius apollo]
MYVKIETIVNDYDNCDITNRSCVRRNTFPCGMLLRTTLILSKMSIQLVNVTTPLSFQDKRKVSGQQYPTYKDACLALGLLEDDNHWDSMLAEAALNCTGKQIRLLFAIVLTTCFPTHSQMLWDNHKNSMTDDVLPS